MPHHSRCVWLLLLALGVAAASAAEPPAPPPASYALLVGVCAYEHASLPPLTYAENDVEQLARELDRPGSPFHQRVRLLTTGRGRKRAADRPTAANVKAAVEQLLADRTRRETVLVALTGHGVQLLVPDPEGKQDDRSYGYFCPADAQLSGVNYRTGQAERLVLLPGLLQKLGDCGAGSKLLVVDACRNQLRLKQRSLVIRHDMVPNGVAALFSCKPGEVSYEAEKLKHGVFFHFLLEGLRGGAKNRRGEVTWARLAEYATEKVTEDAATLIGEQVAQTPHLVANLAGRSPVLTGPLSEAERLYRQGLELYGGGRGSIELREALRLFRRAAEQGHGVAQLALAVCLTWEAIDRGEADPAADGWAQKGLAAARARAAAGDPDAQVWLGGAYAHGLGVAKDDGQAAGWYRKAAAQNDPGGQYQLAMLFMNGWGVAKDEQEGAAWYRKAADQGHTQAEHMVGWCYENGRGVTKDHARAVAWFRQAAAKGHRLSAFGLGLHYANGWGVTRDEAEAVRWYHKSADLGHAQAQHMVGWCYEGGRGVAKDHARAVAWYRKAAAQNHALSQFGLGLHYANGWGVTKDEAEAVRWYHKSAAQGFAGAQHNLGLHYLDGSGVARDDGQAVHWYRKAAEQNDPGGQYFLGWCYENGRGVAKDPGEAKKWYQKAADQGHPEAVKRLKGLK